jgi:hypothetical protein
MNTTNKTNPINKTKQITKSNLVFIKIKHIQNLNHHQYTYNKNKKYHNHKYFNINQ